MENIEIFETQDGSLGLYNKDLDEIYHSKFGAKKESFEKFVEPSLILNDRPLKILDICYGVGYNTKCAIEHFKNIELIDCVEINLELIKKSFDFPYSTEINKIIEKNFKNPDFIYFYADDIRKIVKNLDKYDIIFHDGFSPVKQAEVWSEDLIYEISKHLKPQGLYLTYNHSKPVLKALQNSGLFLGKTISENRTIGTVASYDKKLILNPFSDFEIGCLDTKSAITYKDKNFDLTHSEIVLNRKKEIENSKLMTLSHYLKLNKS